MSKAYVQDVTVTETTGTDLTVEFPLWNLPVTTVQGVACYKAETILPSSSLLIPDLDDLDEIILPAAYNETILFELEPVQGG